MIKIGLTGSIAMGKSEVAKAFRESGIPVFDADDEVHRLYNSKQGADLLRNIVPDAIRDETVDRGRLSQLVLQDPSLLPQVEQRVHAEIAARRNHFLAGAQQQGHGLVVLDIPLLFEKATENSLDLTIVVSAPPQLQRQRALARPGMTEEKLDMILKRQMPDAEKRKRADYVIENDASLDDLRQRSIDVITKIKADRGL
jgi:dephospho-CoA kinase